MTPASKPLPNIDDPIAHPFWVATQEGKLVVQRCIDCGYHRFPPSPICPECLTESDEWVEIRPTGTLYSYATYHRALDTRFSGDVPYTVGYVELDDGPRMIGTVLSDPDRLVIGGAVRAVFDEVAPKVTLVHWAPVRGCSELHVASVT